MKSMLSFLVFAVAVSQISAAKLNVTIFYETLCPDCAAHFKNQVYPAFQDANIRNNVYLELVPFGLGEFALYPFRVICHHGPQECLGNAINGCFIFKNPDLWKQVAFITCCLTDPNPPHAGENCAKKLGYSYEGIEDCAYSNVGLFILTENGKRTLKFEPEITKVPTIVYNNVYNEDDQKESLTNMKALIQKKLKAAGVSTEED